MALVLHVHILCWSLEGNHHVFRVNWFQLEMLTLQNRQPLLVLKGKRKTNLIIHEFNKYFYVPPWWQRQRHSYSRSLQHIWRDLCRYNKSKWGVWTVKISKKKVLRAEEILLHDYRVFLKFQSLCLLTWFSHFSLGSVIISTSQVRDLILGEVTFPVIGAL